MMRFRDRLSDQRGVTLVELLVVIVLLGVVGSYMTRSMVSGMRATMSTQSRFDGLADLQQSVNRMTRELRAADPLVRASSNTTTAVVETYRDASFTTKLRYTYTYCPTQQHIVVRREVNPSGTPTAISCGAAGNTVLIPNVNNGATPVFAYQRADGTAAGAADKVFRIQVTVQRAVTGPPADTITVRTTVRLRNERA